MLANYEYDELADDDPRLDVVEPMQPIRLPYETGSLRQIQRDVLATLGLIAVEVRGNLFALNEVDTMAVRIAATEELMADGLAEELVTDTAVLRRAEAMVRLRVFENANRVPLSALHDIAHEPPLAEVLAALQDETKAQGQVNAAARRHAIGIRAVDRISEIEAA